MITKNNIPERLKTLREEAKLTQTEVASMVGLTQNAIFRYESGRNEPPCSVLLWYADYFQVSLDYIFGRTGNKQGKLFAGQISLSDKDKEAFVKMAMTPGTKAYDALMKEILAAIKGEKQ
jgi:transcriptional regulator with XRE-family HTH domain